MNRKELEVAPYDPLWPEIFEVEAALIRSTLNDNYISIHHIGSTAIPGMLAKPKIDIIAEVKDCDRSIKELENIGYQYKGEWNIPFKYGFTKRGNIKVNLHVFEQGHPEVELNLAFRDYLNNSFVACHEYANLKRELLKDSSSYNKQTNSIFTGYNLGKDKFIRRIIKLTGFNKLRLLYCSHDIEWQEYHRIKVNEIFSRHTHIIYDYNHPHLTHKNHYHFVLCKGADVVAIGHMEDLGDGRWGLRALATDKAHQKQGYGKILLEKLEKWCELRGGAVIHTHAALEAENFYRRLGYIDMPWNDKSISDNVIDLAKLL